MIPWLEEVRKATETDYGAFTPLQALLSRDRLLALIAVAERAQEHLAAYDAPDQQWDPLEEALEQAEQVP